MTAEEGEDFGEWMDTYRPRFAVELSFTYPVAGQRVPLSPGPCEATWTEWSA